MRSRQTLSRRRTEMRSHGLRFLGVLSVGVGLGVLSGCSNSLQDPELSEHDQPYQVDLAMVISEAADMGASDEQLQILRDIAAAGRAPTFDEYSEAVHRTLDCARAAGVSIHGPSPGKSRNLPTLNWGYGGGTTDEENERRTALHDECQNAHSRFIESAYAIQPAAMAWEDETFEDHRAEFLACLRSYDVTISDDVTRNQLLDANSDLMAREPNWEGPNCIYETGLGDAWSQGDG